MQNNTNNDNDNDNNLNPGDRVILTGWNGNWIDTALFQSLKNAYPLSEFPKEVTVVQSRIFEITGALCVGDVDQWGIDWFTYEKIETD